MQHESSSENNSQFTSSARPSGGNSWQHVASLEHSSSSGGSLEPLGEADHQLQPMVLADTKDWSQEESDEDGDEDRDEDGNGDGGDDSTLQRTIADLTPPPPSLPPPPPPLRPVPFVPPNQPPGPQNSHTGTSGKDNTSRRHQESTQTQPETASPMAWSDNAESSAGMMRAFSAFHASRSSGLEEGEIDEHRTAQGDEVHPQVPVQRPRAADPNYSPIHRHSSLIQAMKRNRTQDPISAPTDQDEFESVLVRTSSYSCVTSVWLQAIYT